MNQFYFCMTVMLLGIVSSAPTANAWFTFKKTNLTSNLKVQAPIVADTNSEMCVDIDQKITHIKLVMGQKNAMFMDACFIHNELVGSWTSNKCGDTSDKSVLNCEDERLAACQSTKNELQIFGQILANQISHCEFGIFLAAWDGMMNVYNTSSSLNCGFLPPIYPNDPIKTFKADASSVLGDKAQSCFDKFNL